jgi:hypothetical protein
MHSLWLDVVKSFLFWCVTSRLYWDKSISMDTELPSVGEIQRDRANKLFETLSKESDRGLVLVSAAYLDETLELLLRSIFSVRHTKTNSIVNPLFDAYGPLGTFSGKIRVSHSLEFISKWMRYLN